MKKISILALLAVLSSVLAICMGCTDTGGTGSTTDDGAFHIAGRWQVTDFEYRNNDETNAFSDLNFVFHEMGSNPEITFDDINSAAEYYGSYTYTDAYPTMIVLNIDGISKGHFFPHEWTMFINDNNHIFLNGGENRSGLEFNTSIRLERIQ